MSRKGREFEIEYEKYYRILDPSIYKVESPSFLIDKITGSKREVDILISFKDEENIERKISIECRDRPTTVQDVTWIEQLATKKNDLGIDITIASTTNSFTKPAILKAQAYGIVVQESTKIDENFIKKLTQVHYYTVSFLKVKAIDLVFFDDSSLMIQKNDIKLSTTQEEKDSIEEYINESFMWSNVINTNYQKIYSFTDTGIGCFTNRHKIDIATNHKTEKSIFKSKTITKINLELEINAVNISIPLLGGLIINDPISSSLHGYRKEFKNLDFEIEEVNSSDQNLFKLKIDYKSVINENLKLVSILSPQNIENLMLKAGTEIQMIMDNFNGDYFFGKVIFKEIWK
ncbi:hypothetical protein AAYQ05_16180 [Flavobacterium sp. B11]|uniref:hypothetical protein n=1 Tax=Flavobacterium movens TaxID=214860 RepID=UPI0031E1FCA8